MSTLDRSYSPPVHGSGLPLVAIVSAIGGAMLLWYGWKRRSSRIGRLTSTLGMSLLARAVANPRIAGLLGPMQSFLTLPLTAAQKFLV